MNEASPTTDNDSLNICDELAKAMRERDAFVREAEKRVAFLDGVIAGFKRICQQADTSSQEQPAATISEE